MDQINHFLEHFHEHEDTITTFTSGCSYWFAVVLLIRFMKLGAQIVYDQAGNRFATVIGGRVYDITGDVTDGHDWVLWSSMRYIDELETKRIVSDCINFADEE